MLKGGLQLTSSGVEKAKKKKRKHKEVVPEGEEPEGQETGEWQGRAAGSDVDKPLDLTSRVLSLAGKPVGISVMSNKSYEEEFALEMNKVEKKAGSAVPKVLHGYNKKVKGKTAEERLDMRSCECGWVGVGDALRKKD